jgi:hypothetical protein
MMHNLPTHVFTLPIHEVHAVVEGFVYFLRHDAAFHLCHSTISQYLSHLADMLLQLHFVDHLSLLRNPIVTAMIAAYRLEDRTSLPERLKVKIPFTTSLMLLSLPLLAQVYPAPMHLPTQTAIRTAMAFGISLAVRPSEYLYTDGGHRGPHQANSSLTYFSFPHPYSDEYIPSHATHLFPRSASSPSGFVPPLAMFCMLDSAKNDPFGHGAPRVLHAAPSDSQVCHLQLIFAGISTCPPRPDEPLFSGFQPPITAKVINRFFHLFADRNGLDPHRLTAHSMCSGSVAQLAASGFSLEQIRAHTHHATVLSQGPYMRMLLQIAALQARALNDPTVGTVQESRLLYNAH